MTRHASADFTETEQGDEDTEDEEDEYEDQGEGSGEELAEDDEDGEDDIPLLPIFSAAHLGMRSHIRRSNGN